MHQKLTITPLVTNITQLLFIAQGGEDVVGVSMVGEVEKENIKEFVIQGWPVMVAAIGVAPSYTT